MKGDILKARINSFVGILFVGSFALLAGIIIWQVAFNENPLVQAFEKYTFVQAELDN